MPPFCTPASNAASRISSAARSITSTYTEQDDFHARPQARLPSGYLWRGRNCPAYLVGKWGNKYAVAVRAWDNDWPELSAFFDLLVEIRRLDTNNAIKSYHPQLRKVAKNKTVFPIDEAIRKAFFLVHRDIATTWTIPLPNWASILNQLVIYLDGRIAPKAIHTIFLTVSNFAIGRRLSMIRDSSLRRRRDETVGLAAKHKMRISWQLVQLA